MKCRRKEGLKERKTGVGVYLHLVEIMRRGGVLVQFVERDAVALPGKEHHVGRAVVERHRCAAALNS